jgi:hypothetical protein
MQVMVERSLTLVSWRGFSVRPIVGARRGVHHQNYLHGAGANLNLACRQNTEFQIKTACGAYPISAYSYFFNSVSNV